MVDVAEKASTKRRAEATGTIRMSNEAFSLVRDKKLPKGDALSLAEMAGISAAKQTSNLLPLCHPLPLEMVRVKCDLEEAHHAVRVHCVVATTGKTGVEMEALTGASIALLCLYDLIKMVDPALVVEQVRLNYKEGGKHGHWNHPQASLESKEDQLKKESVTAPLLLGVNGSVITISDRVSQGVSEDAAGPIAVKWFQEHQANLLGVSLVLDEKARIQSTIRELVEQGSELIVTTGGTGMGPRDITIQALQEISTKEIRGIGEFLRHEGSKVKRTAWLSNSTAFILDKTLIIALPGSPKAVSQGLTSLTHLIRHALHITNGGNHG
jgi:molybdenum cofactor biosynthesis protein MoaC